MRKLRTFLILRIARVSRRELLLAYQTSKQLLVLFINCQLGFCRDGPHLCPGWAQVKHENGNGLDNRRENLRGVGRAD